MAISEITVRSLGELIDAITPPEADPVTRRRRDSGVYHGSKGPRRPLLTSLDRLGGTEPPHTKAHLEGHILRNFVRYSRPYLPAGPTNEWEFLVIAQHYGAPTRLLDWSYSPLVAAHFATRDPIAPGPRVIWRLDWQKLHANFNLPPLALLIEDLHGVFGGGESFTPWRLFEGSVPTFACMIEPPSLDARVSAQGAVFTLCSDARQSFDAFLAAQGLEPILTRFIVPPEAVGAVRDQLDMVGTDDRRLFPGLDGVAAALRHYYG
jgi:hypothetical protein